VVLVERKLGEQVAVTADIELGGYTELRGA
jgi:hypothetical protein